MMKYDFDQIIDRRGTSCLKYDFAVERGKREDVLPLWVADMDFRVAEPILKRLHACVDHGIFGYSEAKDDYFQAVAGWYREHFDWEVKRNWLVKTPGVVFAIAAAVRAFTEKGDGVLLQQPVYYPFSEAIRDNGRELVNSPLKLVNGHYEMDFDDLERKIVEHKVTLFLLCSPHNPVGRVWTEEELRRVAAIIEKYNLWVVSDEIHCDLIRCGRRHIPMAKVMGSYPKLITCMAPTKTFNMAGLAFSNIIIRDPALRARYQERDKLFGMVNPMSLTAAQAAYAHGGAWHEALKQYLDENFAFVKAFLARELPEAVMYIPEATYLAWVDLSHCLPDVADLPDFFANKAGVLLEGGDSLFVGNAKGYVRLNLAMPRAIIQTGLERMRDAIRKEQAEH